MNFLQFPNRKGDKIYFHYDYGRGKGQRPSTGIFIYAKPKDQVQKNHNKEALKLLDVKKSEAIIEKQAIGSAFIPAHKFKANFLDYYQEFVDKNKRVGTGTYQIALHNLNCLLKRILFLQLKLPKTFASNFVDFSWINITV